MNSDPKFVIFDNEDAGEVAVIFPPCVAHIAVGRNRLLGKPVSAGFFHIDEGGAHAYGESESLKLKARLQAFLDDRVLNQALRLGLYNGR